MARDDDDLDLLDDTDPPTGDRVDELDDIEDATSTAFDVIDMVALYGSNYALGYEIIDDDYGDGLQAHRYVPEGGFELVNDADLVAQLLAMSVSDEENGEGAVSDALTYAIVDTVAVGGDTWTMGRKIDGEGEPDVFRYQGHGKSFLRVDVPAELRAKIEDAIRGFEEDDLSFEQVDFDIVNVVEHEGETYALGYALDEEADERPLRVWRHLGEGLGFEIIDAKTKLHDQVTAKFPGFFEDESV